MAPPLLDTYLACHLRFYYRAVLNLHEPEAIGDRPDARAVGELIHRILQRFFTPLVGRPLKAEGLQADRLHAVIDACFEEEFGQPLSPALALLRRKISRRLEAYLAWQNQQLTTQDITIRALEKRLEVAWNGFRLKGIIDRIEQRDNNVVLLDYKTGGYPTLKPNLLNLEDRSSWSKAIGSFQLPFYRLLYALYTKQPCDRILAMYISLGEQELKEVNGGIDTLENYMCILEVLRRVLQEINTPEIPFMPAEVLEKACPRCPYQSLCGTQWVQ